MNTRTGVSPWRRLLCTVAVAVAAVLLVVVGAGPASADGRTHVVLRPSKGPVGTVVHYTGHLSKADYRLVSGIGHVRPGLTAQGEPGYDCEASAELLDNEGADVDPTTHRLSGRFVIGATAGCTHGQVGTFQLQPGPYELHLACEACYRATFTVTPARPGELAFTGPAHVGELAISGGVLALSGVLLLAIGVRRPSARHR